MSSNSERLAESSTMKVLEAARDLHALHQLVTREALEQATQLTLHVVDERVRLLINYGELIRKQKGVYEPTVRWPEPRAISKTVLPDGRVKIEVGDELLTLTPHEDRMLSSLQTGAGMQLTAIEANRQMTVVHASLADRVQKLERRDAAK